MFGSFLSSGLFLLTETNIASKKTNGNTSKLRWKRATINRRRKATKHTEVLDKMLHYQKIVTINKKPHGEARHGKDAN